MKFIQLKSELKKGIRPAYVISGDDRFLCFSALGQIKKALGIQLDQLNEVILQGSECSKEDIVAACNVFPVMDNYRLVQVNDFMRGQKARPGEDKLLEYLKQPMRECVLVFFCLGGADALKPYAGLVIDVDCNKMDKDTLFQILLAKVKAEKAEIEPNALETLIMFCSCDMSRINSELEKLISFKDGKTITQQDVEDLVVEDKEYQVFQLSDFIAKGMGQKALDLVSTLSLSAKTSGFAILTPLYNHYRRALYTAVNRDKTNEELGSLLQCSPYAVKVLRGQNAYFSPRKLKQVVDLLYEADRNIKMGKVKEEIAIKKAVINILKIRG